MLDKEDNTEEELEEAISLDDVVTRVLSEKKSTKKVESDESESDEDEDEVEEAKDEDDSDEDEVEEAKSTKEEDESDEDEDDSDEVDEDVEIEEAVKSAALEALLESDDSLDSEFKAKAVTIFEAAVAEKVLERQETLSEQYEAQLVEQVVEIEEKLTNSIDTYLSYVVESWTEDNQVSLDASLRTDIAESFMGKLKNLFTESYIEVPESKRDLCDDLAAEVESVKESLADTQKNAEVLAEGVVKLTREKILQESSEGLSDLQVDKLAKLVEDVEFVNESAFTTKVETVAETFFKKSVAGKAETVKESVQRVVEIVEDNVSEEDKSSPIMKAYGDALSRGNK